MRCIPNTVTRGSEPRIAFKTLAMSAVNTAGWLLEVDKWKTSSIQLLESGDRSRGLAVGDTVLAKLASSAATAFR
jgi:hypothetical protein